MSDPSAKGLIPMPPMKSGANEESLTPLKMSGTNAESLTPLQKV